MTSYKLLQPLWNYAPSAQQSRYSLHEWPVLVARKVYCLYAVPVENCRTTNLWLLYVRVEGSVLPTAYLYILDASRINYIQALKKRH